MGLITCPECGREGVSDQAGACPGCGFPLAPGEPTAPASAGEPEPARSEDAQRALSAGLLTGAQVSVRESGRHVASGSLVVKDEALFVDTADGRIPLCAFSEVRELTARGPRVRVQTAERRLSIRFATHLAQERARRKGALADLVGLRLPAERTQRQPRRGVALMLAIAIGVAGFSLLGHLQRGCQQHFAPPPPAEAPLLDTEGGALSADNQRQIYRRAEALRARAKREADGDEQRYALEDRYLDELAAEQEMTRETLDAVLRRGQLAGWGTR